MPSTPLAQIAAGLAWHFTKYGKEPAEEERERYSFAEMKAQAEPAGFRADPAPSPPWEWRMR